MAQLFKFEGKLFKEVGEHILGGHILGGCGGCDFNKGVSRCQAFHSIYPSVNCVGNESIFVEYKEKSDAPS